MAHRQVSFPPGAGNPKSLPGAGSALAPQPEPPPSSPPHCLPNENTPLYRNGSLVYLTLGQIGTMQKEIQELVDGIYAMGSMCASDKKADYDFICKFRMIQASARRATELLNELAWYPE